MDRPALWTPPGADDFNIDETIEVSVREIRVAADIGVYAHEKGRLQALVIDVVLQIDPPLHDALTATIDYNAVVSHALDLAGQRTQLIETFARKLAMLCLQDVAVRSIDVCIRKPGALANGVAGAHVLLRRQPDNVGSGLSEWNACATKGSFVS